MVNCVCYLLKFSSCLAVAAKHRAHFSNKSGSNKGMDQCCSVLKGEETMHKMRMRKGAPGNNSILFFKE